MGSVIVPCNECRAKNRIPEKKQHLRPKCGKCGVLITVGPYAESVNLGDNDFQQFIKSAELPVVVDFFAPTCGPCQALAPLISKLAKQYLGKVIVAKLDTSQHPGSAAHYNIRGVPSLLFFKKGVLVDQIIGAPPETELRSKLDSILKQ